MITPASHRDPELVKKLDAVAGRVLRGAERARSASRRRTALGLRDFGHSNTMARRAGFNADAVA